MSEFRQLEQKDIEEIIRFKKELSNMDLERRETEINKFRDGLAKTSKEEVKKYLPKIIKKGIMTREEYKKEYEGKYVDENEIDGLSTIFGAVLSLGDLDTKMIVTASKKMLKDSKKIEKKFGVKIIDGEQAIKIMQKKALPSVKISNNINVGK